MFFPNGSSAKIGKKVIENLFYFPEGMMLDCNQYVVVDKQSGALSLFDAGNGISLKGLIEGLTRLELDIKNLKNVYLTHEHVDHVLGLYALMKIQTQNPPKIFAYGETAKILKEGDEEQIFPGELGIRPKMFGVEIVPLNVIDLTQLKEVEVTSEFKFQIHYTPGHSLGSISYYEPSKKILIPGDLVFTGGSFGRYDFPGGSLQTLQRSIEHVSNLDVTYLLPGHMDIADDGNQQILHSYRMACSIHDFF